MANLSAIFARDQRTDNPLFVVRVEVRLVYGIVVSMPSSELEDNKHEIYVKHT